MALPALIILFFSSLVVINGQTPSSSPTSLKLIIAISSMSLPSLLLAKETTAVTSSKPSVAASLKPTGRPTLKPIKPTLKPTTAGPTSKPTMPPSFQPTNQPSRSSAPTEQPTKRYRSQIVLSDFCTSVSINFKQNKITTVLRHFDS
jgi:hypothetical protein